MSRKACVSGSFYDSDKKLLNKNIEKFFKNNFHELPAESTGKRSITAAVAPHAGYVYSGSTASYTFNEIARDGIPETIIILGPNHTGYGDKLAMTSDDTWEMPMGTMEVDVEFKKELVNTSNEMTIDEFAHYHEHSIEVELPFLQYISKLQNKEIKIVPIIISLQYPQLCVNLAHDIYEVSQKLNRDIIILASTDLTHYEDSKSASEKDHKVLKSIENMDINEMIDNINTYQITMCGYGPVITAIEYSKLMNANKSKCLNYSCSGDAFGDYDSVVGYGSAIIKT
ncbi:MAG: MEMO1 family protein [Methanosphaera stadtmanae]|nr:MEMO1 family protein [Methanosphaera stadtmanae]